MSNPRKKYSEAEERVLFNQVDGLCPLCSQKLHYKKQNKTHKKYEIAHIYPLNPTTTEVSLLNGEKRLAADVNDLDNVIPLCLDCHEQFDKPRTVEEYRQLYSIKERLIELEKLQNLYHSCDIEDELIDIINCLTSDLGEDISPLDYGVLKIDEKLKSEAHPLFKRRIRDDVSDYYVIIQQAFGALDKASSKFEIIAGQVRTFYLKAKSQTNDQEIIFNNMAEWLHIKTKCGSLESCKVIISFFVQNCEVFGDAT